VPEWLQSILANVALIKSSRILFLLIVAILSRLIIHKLIDRSVQQSIRRPVKLRAAVVLESASGLPAERRSQRLLALSSLAKSITTVVILIVTLVAVLAELGFNVTTIVAGTSVVAAAIAFGTQSIVKDLLSGIFLLVEDQLGVGDYVDMQLASGTVEEIGLRITQLRSDEGTVWYVRNGEVLRLANFSKGGPDRPSPVE
jgi:small-conductance mechanosensitive channel